MDQDRTATLLRLATQLREVAEDADRRDVVAKADEALALIAGGGGSTKTRSGKGPTKLDTALTILGLVLQQEIRSELRGWCGFVRGQQAATVESQRLCGPQRIRRWLPPTE